jgi:N-methylhydantoinase B
MHRGGDGIVREFEFLTKADVTILSDRRERGPYGQSGGSSGARGKNSLLRGKRAIAIPGKARFEVHVHDVLRIESPGGGGYGYGNPK